MTPHALEPSIFGRRSDGKRRDSTTDLLSAYVPFTPSESEQRLHSPYYRSCWHGVSRCFFLRLGQYSSLMKGVYNPKAFIPHAVSLHQAFAHCARFPTAAIRRCRDRVSVPVWPFNLSVRLPVIALVGRYPAN